ncbi:MAG: SDR family oxidoreductase [Ruminococcaceae bacterium]|nr:SDR family oxidoreductase [Oscillospiraceae bacterium]
MSKTVVVTGGSKGIGAAISSLFARECYNVVVNYNTSEAECYKLCDELAEKGFSCKPFKADISKPDEANALIKFAVDTFGSLDVLINNAGIAEFCLFTDITDEQWDRMISVNLTGTFNTCRAAAKEMIRNHSGSIINISSMWGICGSSCEVHYSASKSGVIGLTKALAKELGPSNIRVNCVAPGVIKTDMNAMLTPETVNDLKNETPLCRIGTPQDVASAVLFLSSDKASFITGQILGVDGGFVV